MDKRIIALITAGLFATAASAGGEKSFSDMDKDGDGQISKEEASGSLKDKWDQADANADGNVDQSEFSAFEQAGGGTPEGGDAAGAGAPSGSMETPPAGSEPPPSGTGAPQ